MVDLLGLEWILNNEQDEHPIKSFLRCLPPNYTRLAALQSDELKLSGEDEADPVDVDMVKYLHIDNEIYCHMGHLLLNHLEKCLRILEIKPGVRGFTSLRAKLTNPNQFFGTLSEIEVAAFLKESDCGVILEPDISGKTPDLKAFIDGGWVYFEVYTPLWRMDTEDEKVHPGGFTLYTLKTPEKDPLALKLIEKYNQNIAEMVKDGLTDDKAPIVVVMNIGYSHFDKETDPDRALHGTPVLRILLDKQTGEYVGESGGRKPNGIIFTEPRTENISAVIAYNREFTVPDCRAILLGRFHKNPYCTRNKLNDDQMEILKKVFNDCSSS